MNARSKPVWANTVRENWCSPASVATIPNRKQPTATIIDFTTSPPENRFQRFPFVWSIDQVVVRTRFCFPRWGLCDRMAELHPMRLLEYINVTQSAPNVKKYTSVFELLSFSVRDGNGLMSFRKLIGQCILRELWTWIQDADSYWSRAVGMVSKSRLLILRKFFGYDPSFDSSGGSFSDIFQSDWNSNAISSFTQNDLVRIVRVKHEPAALLHFQLLSGVYPQKESEYSVKSGGHESQPRSPTKRILYCVLLVLVGGSISFRLLILGKNFVEPFLPNFLLLIGAFTCLMIGFGLILDGLVN
jgi:hypothetical protein